jgi:hypothetical protein
MRRLLCLPDCGVHSEPLLVSPADVVGSDK